METANPYAIPTSVVEDTPSEIYKPKLFALSGRIGRLRFLAYSFLLNMLWMLALILVTALVFQGAEATEDQAMLIGIVFYIPSFAVYFILARRRLNDLNQGGWLSLMILIPVANLFFSLYLMLWPGTKTANRFGPRPEKTSMLLILFGLILPIVLLVLLVAFAIPAFQEIKQHSQGASQSLEY